MCLSSGVGVRERREVPLSLRRADDQTSSGGTESIRPFFPFSPSSLSTVFLFSKVLREAHGALEPIHTCMRARQARQMEEERKWRKQAEMTSTFFLFFHLPTRYYRVRKTLSQGEACDTGHCSRGERCWADVEFLSQQSLCLPSSFFVFFFSPFVSQGMCGGELGEQQNRCLGTRLLFLFPYCFGYRREAE